jgi:hypothetical protein
VGVTVRVVPGAKTRRELKQRKWNGKAIGLEKTKAGNLHGRFNIRSNRIPECIIVRE